MISLSDLMDTPRLYTALAEWGACFIYIFMQRRRLSNLKSAASILGMLGVFIVYHQIAGILPLYFWIPSMIGIILIMYLFLFCLCDTTWQDACFCCIRAFVLAEFTASFHWQLYVWGVATFQEENLIFSVLSMLLIYAGIYCVYYILERNHIPKDEKMNIGIKELYGAVMIALAAFTISNISFIMPNTPFSSTSSSILYVRTLVDFGGLVMLFAQQDKREELRMRSENQAMNIVLQRQYDQYRLSIDTMELLRKEFHDLKHYMIAIRSEQNPSKREQYLTEMEQAISTQEAFSNTGNSVLDVVLTTKSVYCVQNNITFTCMADGNLISFMHVKDICSIFGNALDNALECVSQFEDPEKRVATLSMSKQNQFLLIQFENYTETPLNFKKTRLPATTKSNKQYHGYGLKSIRQTALKYDGSITLQSKNNWFTLQILIPIGH